MASSAKPPTLRIVSSFPLSGPNSGQTLAIVRGIDQAFSEANYQVVTRGRTYRIEYEPWDGVPDDAVGAQKWRREQENACRAAADRSILLSFGSFNTDAAKASVNIRCQADLTMIAFATYPGLTRSVGGVTDPGEPAEYYRGCTPNLVRLVTSDDIQGLFAARLAQGTGARSAFVLCDGEAYGCGLARVFAAAAPLPGFSVVSGPSPNKPAPEEVDPGRADPAALAKKIADSGADLVFYAGRDPRAAGRLWRQLDGELRTRHRRRVRFVAGDTLFDRKFLEEAGESAIGVYITFPGVPPNILGPQARAWYDAYRNHQLSEPVRRRLGFDIPAQQPDADVYAAVGYEAGRLALWGLAEAGKGGLVPDRVGVRNAIFNTPERDSVLSPNRWRFSKEGDTTLRLISVTRVVRQKTQAGEELRFETPEELRFDAPEVVDLRWVQLQGELSQAWHDGREIDWRYVIEDILIPFRAIYPTWPPVKLKLHAARMSYAASLARGGLVEESRTQLDAAKVLNFDREQAEGALKCLDDPNATSARMATCIEEQAEGSR